MVQGKLPCTVTRCHFLPGDQERLIATEFAVLVTSASSLEVTSSGRFDNERDVHFGEKWTLSEHGGTRRVCWFVMRPNWQRRLSCVWFEIMKRMSGTKTQFADCQLEC